MGRKYVAFYMLEDAQFLSRFNLDIHNLDFWEKKIDFVLTFPIMTFFKAKFYPISLQLALQFSISYLALNVMLDIVD